MELVFRRRCRSPLLLALIFITFFHSALSRHRIRHYKDRFKRQQGAHLYLPESYVIEGGDGPDQGPWMEWTEPSPCSRTCGGGVSTQYRQCQDGFECQGPSRRHFSCNTQDCPDTGDFRAQQCSEYDEIPFENVKYQWVPYTKGPNPCELNCMPKGQRFYYRHASQVVDGTRCNDESLDVCVNGKCQPVGCDMMLGSYLKEDECRICGGDGSTCNTITNTLDLNDMQVGYNDILLIPAGATNIVVEETAPSNNYLAIRNTSGHYYLNGNWRIDFPRSVDFAGSKFHYERYPQGFAAPDKIYTLGPIDEAIFIVLLYQDATVPVEYKYSLPTNVQPGSEYETYAWTFDEYTPCTATCGGGVQYRNVSCAGRKTLEPVDETLCDASRKPETSRKCNEVACDANWVPYPWGNCSVPCGEEGGVQTREISCQRIIGSGYPGIVDESECVGPKPPQQQTCNKGVTCAQWHTDPWKPCDHLCGNGKQTRNVQCFIRDEKNKIQLLEDAHCEAVETKPAIEQSCFNRPCEGVDWITSEWSGCDAICGLTNETRKIFCATASGQIYADDLCDESTKPATVRQCDGPTNASCNYLWYASQWSECSAKCGKGIQTRTLFCGLSTADGVKKVDNDKCDQSKTFETIKNCTGKEECDGEWFSGPWSECSKACGGGERTKKVVCIQANEVVDVSHCDADSIIFSHEDCNQQACTEDSELPVDKNTPLNIQDSKKTTTEAAEDITEATTTEISSTDLSELTKSFEFTTEPQAEESKISEDDYEVVAADSCDDGEWVEVLSVVKEEEEPEQTEETAGITTEAMETAYSIYDMMMSDGTTIDETPLTGSGDDESTLGTSSRPEVTEEEEGSGTIVTDEETASVVVTESAVSEGSTITITEGSTITITEASDSSTGTTEESGSSEGSSEIPSTTSSGSSESTISGDTSETTQGGTTQEITTVIEDEHQCQLVFDECEKLHCPLSEIVPYINEDNCLTCRCKDSSSPSSPDAASTTTTELSTSESTTEYSTSIITTETTEGSSSTSESSTSESTTIDSSTSESTTDASSTPIATSESSETDITIVTPSTESIVINEPSEDVTPPPRVIDTDEETEESTDSTTEASGASEGTSETFTSTTETFTSTAISEETSESAATASTIWASTEESVASTTTSETSGSTEVSGTTETSGFTETSDITTEITTEVSGSTEYDIFSTTTEGGTESTTWSPLDIFKKKQRMCKRRKILQCKTTTYGCCWDNIHAAKGPFDKGCPTPKTCKESTYGCCPDGVSAALGPKNRGCPSSHCNETLFGCCWDEKTPAEGNDEEGCPPKPPACVSSKWGCCKDNVTEAKGPSQKGCEPDKPKEVGTEEPTAAPTEPPSTEDCKNSTYGCCPDGLQAQGPQYQGCKLPCANSTYGCCPDKETPAHGYRGEGCCLSSPFGCCPDDVTPARGPNGDGCACQFLPFGCCPDGITAAKGYQNEGCGCQYSEHGCCPDDVTSASGPDYEGCLCHTFQFGCCPDGVTVAQGPHQQGCDCRSSEFGCCSDEKTAAKGPNEEGCTCDVSKYGCCLDGVSTAKGEDFQGCEEIPVDRQEACSLPKERGTCRNYTVKWFFDMTYGGCSRFWYGGCDGNENRFKTKEECEGVCVKPQGIERCNLPKVNGSCEGYFLQWYYDKQARQCSQFVYGGCLGNNNRFESREECSELCSKDDSADPCEQSRAEGPCRGQHRRYYFDKDTSQCQEFVYGGCRGNNNNFLTLEGCKQKCATPGKKRDYCTIQKDEGNCTARQAKWYYGSQLQRCQPFYYSGCNGNKNNFDTKDACEADCPNEVARNTCHLPADIGECGNYATRWYWDTRYKRCNQFYYGGCGGNSNNFRSEEECESECARVESPPPPPPPQEYPPSVSYSTEPPAQTQPPAVPPQLVGPTSRPPTLDEICSSDPDPGPCPDYATHYYYDGTEGVCKNFTYGGCGGNYNNFETEDICLQYCGSSRPVPQVPQVPQVTTQPPPVYDENCYGDPDPGNCTDQYPFYYYDRNTGDCRPFTYSGCGGNRNKYYSEEDCLRQCGPYRGQDACELEKDEGPCRANVEKFFFNKESGKCESFSYGGCQGNGNRFSSIEECQHYCGERPPQPKPSQSITPTEVCQQPADQGSCPERNHKRWYFDNTQGECKVFIYSGCGGNLNNFVSFQTCLDYCKNFLPNTEPPAVVPEVARKCQAKFDECATLRCPYGIESYVDENDCIGCQCRKPCEEVYCPEGSACGIDFNLNRTSPQDAEFVAVCRENNKTGQCPYPLTQPDGRCENECRTDADCSLHLKCCSTDCGTGTICAEPQKPQEIIGQTEEPAYTTAPYVDVYAPKIDVTIYEPEVTAVQGDQAILNCAVSGNPYPKIVWSKGDLIFDGTQPRYRIRLDQTLQIVTLHKTDSGVYLCTADNSLGQPIQNQIKLEVTDAVSDRPVTIINGQDAELVSNNIVAPFNSPAVLNCYALGWPLPAVTWWKEDELIPLKNREFEVFSDYSLLIHSVKLHNLGVYTCQAYNGEGKAASWSITVRAPGPVYTSNTADVKYLKYVVNQEPVTSTTSTTTPSPTTVGYSYYPSPVDSYRVTQPEATYWTASDHDVIDPNAILPQIPDAQGYVPESLYIVPVRANITTNEQNYPTGSNVEIRCDVYGYPPPQVQWYKDGVVLYSSRKISISDTHTLTIIAADQSDSGRYQCEADNQYSKASSTLDVVIKGMFIHPTCTDNQFFANCKLIVKANFCNHKYYAKFCCRSCTEAGQLDSSPLDTNLI